MIAGPSWGQEDAQETLPSESPEALDATLDSTSEPAPDVAPQTSEDGIENESIEPAVEAAGQTKATPSAPSNEGVAESSQPTSTDSTILGLTGPRYKENDYFGTWRVRVGGSKIEFDDGQRFYNKLYGTPATMAMLAGDWFAWDWFATLGLGFRMGYYHDRGRAAKALTSAPVSDLTEDQIEVDPIQKTTLTVIPLQALALLQFTPFSGRWFVIDGWAGLERTYFRETRVTESKDEKTAVVAAAASEPKKTLTNRGFRSSSVVGAAANIQLNWMDDRSAASMESTLGLRYVYLSPFIEIVRSLEDKGVSFGRSSMGLAFTFESAK
jgi:hypothetical protein